MNATALTNTQQMVLSSLLVEARTAQQISIDTGLSGNTVRPRLIELEERGLVQKSDEERRTLSGRRARVYEAVR